MIHLRGQITSLDEIFEHTHISGVGAEAIFEDRHIGFKLQINNLVSFILERTEPPDFSVGDHIILLIAKDLAPCVDETPAPNPSSPETPTTSGAAPPVSSGTIPSTTDASPATPPTPTHTPT